MNIDTNFGEIKDKERRISMVNKLKIDDFVDLKSLTIDTTKSKQERLKQFVLEVQNPNTTRVGDMIVEVKFTGERLFSDALVEAFGA